jgi:hypothetical protein
MDASKLSRLHAAVSDALLDALSDEDPNVKLRAVGEAVKFLKDNGITYDLSKSGKGVKFLGELPHVLDEAAA